MITRKIPHPIYKAWLQARTPAPHEDPPSLICSVLVWPGIIVASFRAADLSEAISKASAALEEEEEE